MTVSNSCLALLTEMILLLGLSSPQDGIGPSRGGWVKYAQNPVLGGSYGTCFDVSVLKEGAVYRMWFSWRPKKSVALVESRDGIHWSEPQIVLGPNAASGWEEDINRPSVVKRKGAYFLWYTGQAGGKSRIGFATSADGKIWKRIRETPVLSPTDPWEKGAVMNPSVLWEEKAKRYAMWYSAGEQYEPNAIGYATSPDGLHWTKKGADPVFTAEPQHIWEQNRVAGCQAIQRGGWTYLFYIGYRDIDHAQIGVARSRDGLSHWERHPDNPIVASGEDDWNYDACYKPYAVFDGKRWLLWYNGRHGGTEQIGLVTHPGEDLGFPDGNVR